ncbi:hypothetical protein [Methylobacterium sp. P5_C11]
MIHHATPAILPAAGPARDRNAPSDRTAAESVLHGAAFVLLCLWTRTSPDRLRDQLSSEAGVCTALGF